MPLGRFERWLKQSGNYDAYLEKLVEGFNPCAVDGLMCRNQGLGGLGRGCSMTATSTWPPACRWEAGPSM